jgi:hypothetical protein
MSGRVGAVVGATATLALLWCWSCSGADSASAYDFRQGKLEFDASLNACPRIARMSAAPLQLAVGAYGMLRARATDVETNPGSLSYRWHGTRGVHVVKEHAANSAYVCTAPGAQTLTLTVTDEGGCDDVMTIDVLCVP